jgi:hypothetical protein
VQHVRALAVKINEVFTRHFTPTRYLTIDEAMCAFKGRSPIKQYIPSKPHKWGYKIDCLASENDLLHFEVYEGKDDDPSESGSTFDTIIRMVQRYQHRQLILFTDNWFTSPTLMLALSDMGIRLCGSVRTNRKGMPVLNKKMVNRMNHGAWLYLQKNDMCLAVWKDQKVIWVLYNHISPHETATVQRWNDESEEVDIECPKAIHDYFHYARSVDIVSQHHYSYLLCRKAQRCWPRLAWWLIDMCILNAFQLWKKAGGNDDSHLEFRTRLMRELLNQLPANRRPRRNDKRPRASDCVAMYHHSIHVDEDRDCVQCSDRNHQRKRTNYKCAACDKYMCLGQCFALYHSS